MKTSNIFLSFLSFALFCATTRTSEPISIKREQGYWKTGDEKFKTGKWTQEENDIVIELHEQYRQEDSKSIWSKISETLKRRPKLIREHFHAKLDPLLSGNFKFTQDDDALYYEAKRISDILDLPIQWSQLARDLRKPRLVVYFHYAEKNKGRNKKRKNSPINKDSDSEEINDSVSDEQNPIKHEITDRSSSHDSIESTQSRYPLRNRLDVKSVESESIYLASVHPETVIEFVDRLLPNILVPIETSKISSSNENASNGRNNYIKFSRADESLRELMTSYNLFSTLRDSRDVLSELQIDDISPKLQQGDDINLHSSKDEIEYAEILQDFKSVFND